MARSSTPVDHDLQSLEAERLEVSFEGLKALDAVGLKARTGEILGLIGPNGAGKTTLLNVLSGFQRPTRGRVACRGTELTMSGPRRRLEAGISRTFQGVRAFRRLTVRENVELGSIGMRGARAETRARTRRLLAEFELEEFADQTAETLPYGVSRRLGIARAVASEPSFLLLDEPAAGMSEAESGALLRVLLRLREELGCCLVVIEHDMNLIMRLCDRIQVLDHGRTIAVGAPLDIQRDPVVIEAYLGEGVGSAPRQ